MVLEQRNMQEVIKPSEAEWAHAKAFRATFDLRMTPSPQKNFSDEDRGGA
jgi:hypothetical protein